MRSKCIKCCTNLQIVQIHQIPEINTVIGHMLDEFADLLSKLGICEIMFSKIPLRKEPFEPLLDEVM